MGWGKRKADRIQFQHSHSANLMAIDGTWRRSCVLLDISSTGARIEIEGDTNVLGGGEFFLLLSSTGLAFRRCELVRLDGTTVGVRFLVDRRKA
jgi:hypothetical protein